VHFKLPRTEIPQAVIISGLVKIHGMMAPDCSTISRSQISVTIPNIGLHEVQGSFRFIFSIQS